MGADGTDFGGTDTQGELSKTYRECAWRDYSV